VDPNHFHEIHLSQVHNRTELSHPYFENQGFDSAKFHGVPEFSNYHIFSSKSLRQLRNLEVSGAPGFGPVPSVQVWSMQRHFPRGNLDRVITSAIPGSKNNRRE
jgi:hypothetical protein